jgi:DNA-binding NarL/FixJ family response regulator
MHGARVSLVCGHPLLLDGLAYAISSREDYSIVSQTGLALEAFNIAKVDRPDILILDPADDGQAFDTISKIVRLPSNPKIVVISAYKSIEYVMRALDVGATGYLTYASTSGELLECTQTVLGGDTFVSPCIAAKLIASLRTAALRKAAAQKMRLTLREEQIVALLRKGKTNREMAVELNLSEKTVKHYMTVLMQKLAARSRLEVVIALKDFDTATSAPTPRMFN